jgi:hypothetical protein
VSARDRVSAPDRAGRQGPNSSSGRVRVVLGGARSAARRVRPREELEEQTRLGEVLVRGLMRAQLGLALGLSVVVIVGLGSLPVVFAVVPGLAATSVLGVRLPWLLLGGAAFPFLFAVGWVYVRVAERNEREFAALVERQ